MRFETVIQRDPKHGMACKIKSIEEGDDTIVLAPLDASRVLTKFKAQEESRIRRTCKMGRNREA
jgi:hypothetical protein